MLKARLEFGRLDPREPIANRLVKAFLVKNHGQIAHLEKAAGNRDVP